ncbi:MAG: hypothetical protein AB1439_07860 [candidate division FCPU426 bacterium]
MGTIRTLFAACFLACLAWPSGAWARHDPAQDWRELATGHFLFIYPGAHAQAAARAAAWAERIYPEAKRLFGYAPPGLTPIVLAADSDLAGGYAQTIYRKIEVSLTAPENKFFGPRDQEWLAQVLRHEYAHLCHGMRCEGLTAALAAVFGEVNGGNLVAPRWWVEGLAVYAETELSETGGRGRSPWRDLELAANLLSDGPWTMGQLDNDPLWAYPADRVYVAGYDLIKALESTAPAPDLIARLSGRQSAWPLFGLLDTWPAVTGRSAYEVWREVSNRRTAEFRARLGEDRPAIARAAVAAEDSRAFFSQPKWTSHGGLVAYRQSQGEDSALVSIDPSGAIRTAGRPDLPVSRYDYEPGQDAFVYARLAMDPVYTSAFTADLYQWTGGREKRLTRNARAWSPALASDGRLACVVNEFGATRIGLVDLGSGRVDLLPGPQGANYASPAWSPDGRQLAASVRLSGRQDICLVDTATGRLEALTNWDEAGDFNPAWSPDGRRIFFVSDRGGTYQVFAWDIAERRLWQVTRAWLGAFDPVVSPDGEQLAFAEYRPGNIQRIVTAPLDPAAWQAWDVPQPGTQPLAEPEYDLPPAAGPGYSAWPHLAPTYWMPMVGSDADGLLWGAASGRQDPLGMHAWWAQVLYQPASGQVYGNASYTNLELPVILTPRVFREARSRYGRPGERGSGELFWYRAAGAGLQAQLPLVLQMATDRLTSLNVGAEIEAFSLASETAALFPAPDSWQWSGSAGFFSGMQHARDPFPVSGVLGSIHYHSAGPQQAFDGRAVAWNGEVYFPSGIPGHAWKVGARGLNQRGIFPDAFSGPAPLGWSGGVFNAGQVMTLSASYRLPLAHVDNGVGLLPVFFQSLWLEGLAEQGAGWEGGLSWPQWQERKRTSLGGACHLDTRWFWYLPGQISAAFVYQTPQPGWWFGLSLDLGAGVLSGQGSR